MMVKKIKYKGKVWIEHKQPILKSWMMALLVGVFWCGLASILKGFWYFLSFIPLILGLILVQIMYERELREYQK